jgi:small-conductance mechanosensitive channel
MSTTTNTTEWEDLSPECIVENYIRLKSLERERNKKSYEKLKENKDKYFNRLNENLAYQLERVETFKSDEQRLQEFKTRRKDINKRAYEKRKLLKSKSE